MGHLKWKIGIEYQIVLTSLLITLVYSVLETGSECNKQPCWKLYHDANNHYQADNPSVSNQDVKRCIVLRTYKQCLVQLPRSQCSSSLDYRGSLKMVSEQFRSLNCTEDGITFPEGALPDTEEPLPCTFKGKPIYSYCSLFGDPHLITFSKEQMTCKLEGAWPLVDNQFFTVQVTNAPLSVPVKSATATQKVTVIVKGMGRNTPSGAFCGSRDAVFYRAEVGSMPATFADGLKEHGIYNSIHVASFVQEQRVDIYLRYIDTTIIIRQIDSQYFSVGIRMPEEVLNGTISNPHEPLYRQLCVHSCPLSERLNINAYLTTLSSGSSGQKTELKTAQESCNSKGVTDFFFDSCTFDVIMTGDSQFANMALSAYEDLRKFSTRQPRWANRTYLEETSNPQNPRIPKKNPSFQSSSSNEPIRSNIVLHVVLFLLVYCAVR